MMKYYHSAMFDWVFALENSILENKQTTLQISLRGCCFVFLMAFNGMRAVP